MDKYKSTAVSHETKQINIVLPAENVISAEDQTYEMIDKNKETPKIESKKSGKEKYIF